MSEVLCIRCEFTPSHGWSPYCDGCMDEMPDDEFGELVLDGYGPPTEDTPGGPR